MASFPISRANPAVRITIKNPKTEIPKIET
jgi:hypothetical protein